MRPEEPTKANNTVTNEELDYQAKILSASFEIRIFNALVALIVVNVIRKIFCFPVPQEVSTIFYAWLLTCICYLTFFKSGIFRKREVVDKVHFSYYFFGISYATLLVHFLGGVEWIAFFVYIFDLVYGNVLMKRWKGAVITAFAIFGYLSLGFLEYKGIITHHRLLPAEMMTYTDVNYFLGAGVVVVGVVFCLLSFSTGFFARLKEEREKSILDSRKRFEAKSLQLEGAAKTLRTKVAENMYMRMAAIGYVEKKEFELETVKKDLEAQIEKLRKTQRSMFFMIEDLNGMSTQLKDARDHLEDKVRTRTDELLNISKKLHRSERLAFLGKLAGSVTHELRNPLAVLKNAVYYLDKRCSDKKDDKILKYMEILKKEISIIDAIIDDIMGFAKTKSPKIETIDVSAVIENAISVLKVPELISVEKDFEKLPKIKGDSNQLMHAIMNIANNAIVAMKGNGTLTFRTNKDGECACIEIADSGPGIPPDQRDLIFEPLYSSKPKGTGLGLPIAKMMIENQDGRIEFISELGEGTAFKIFLPLKRKADESS
ncbi:MAG: ATP-binding protein [Candidatus Omnitrophota bacterium]